MQTYLKAVIGAALAGLTAALTALTDGHVSGTEWVTIAIAAVGTLGGVYVVPNREPGVDERVAQDVHPDDLDHDSDLPADVQP